MGISNDLTDSREAELQRLNDELERHLRERTAELEAARKELSSFIYSISHDLQAPLRRILGFAGILAEECAERLGEEGRQHLARITAAATGMEQLIAGLLGLSRVTRAEILLVPTDLGALAEVIAAELQIALPERVVDFEIAPALTAVADPNLMRIAMEHLLKNAWKFTGKHPAARIEFGAERCEGETVFFVRDDGAGFDMAYADNLFTPFQRLHRADEFEGAGVGLATVRRIIQRHGGRVWAEGAVERGATFRFTLPAP
jgi:light-regulated signal transduction histidine kinase (bacteriophytochrome)